MKNGPIIKVGNGSGYNFSHILININQNDKAFNASKEDMDYIDNNEEASKVTPQPQ